MAIRTLTLFVSLLVITGGSPVGWKPAGETLSVRFAYHDISAASVSIVGSINVR